jgi:hypothetical protein
MHLSKSTTTRCQEKRCVGWSPDWVIRVVDVSLPVRSTPRPDILCAARRTHIPIPINIELALISQLQLVYEPLGNVSCQKIFAMLPLTKPHTPSKARGHSSGFSAAS